MPHAARSRAGVSAPHALSGGDRGQGPSALTPPPGHLLENPGCPRSPRELSSRGQAFGFVAFKRELF